MLVALRADCCRWHQPARSPCLAAPSRRWETPARCRRASDPVTGIRIRTRDEVDLGAVMASRTGPPSRNISPFPHPHHTSRRRRRSRRSDGGGAPGGGKGGEVVAPRRHQPHHLQPRAPQHQPGSPRQAAASDTGDGARRGAAVQHRRQRRLGHTTAGAPRRWRRQRQRRVASI
ncbi:unnamed protein product [Urochloa humidicola]